MAFTLTFWPVAAPLAGLVDAVYVARGGGEPFAACAGTLLPQVMWRLTGKVAWRCPGGAVRAIGAASVFGPSTAALGIEGSGPLVAVGAGMFPEGWAALLPVPASALIEQVADLADFWGADALRPLDADPSLPDRALAGQVQGVLLGRLGKLRPVDPRVGAINRWANGTGHDINQLVQKLGVSHRHLDRLAAGAHGLPPRLLANRHKILRMAAVLASGARDNRRDTWSSEYADQAHFTRHFRRFIGATPTQFMQDEELLVRGVLQVRLALASTHPLGLAAD